MSEPTNDKRVLSLIEQFGDVLILPGDEVIPQVQEYSGRAITDFLFMFQSSQLEYYDKLQYVNEIHLENNTGFICDVLDKGVSGISLLARQLPRKQAFDILFNEDGGQALADLRGKINCLHGYADAWYSLTRRDMYNLTDDVMNILQSGDDRNHEIDTKIRQVIFYQFLAENIKHYMEKIHEVNDENREFLETFDEKDKSRLEDLAQNNPKQTRGIIDLFSDLLDEKMEEKVRGSKLAFVYPTFLYGARNHLKKQFNPVQDVNHTLSIASTLKQDIKKQRRLGLHQALCGAFIASIYRFNPLGVLCALPLFYLSFNSMAQGPKYINQKLNEDLTVKLPSISKINFGGLGWQ